MFIILFFFFFFFFNDTATTEIYTLSLHDALPIFHDVVLVIEEIRRIPAIEAEWLERSEEHTSELQSQSNLVCRLLLEKKKKKKTSSYLHDIETAFPIIMHRSRTSYLTVQLQISEM